MDFDNAFKDVDVILTPTTPTPAFKFGENIDDPIAMYLNDIFTVTANLAGLPAISLPIKYNKDGLPLALQLFGKSFDQKIFLLILFYFITSIFTHRQNIASLIKR